MDTTVSVTPAVEAMLREREQRAIEWQGKALGYWDDRQVLIEGVREIRAAVMGNAHGCKEQDRAFDLCQRLLTRFVE